MGRGGGEARISIVKRGVPSLKEGKKRKRIGTGEKQFAKNILQPKGDTIRKSASPLGRKRNALATLDTKRGKRSKQTRNRGGRVVGESSEASSAKRRLPPKKIVASSGRCGNREAEKGERNAELIVSRRALS